MDFELEKSNKLLINCSGGSDGKIIESIGPFDIIVNKCNLNDIKNTIETAKINTKIYSLGLLYTFTNKCEFETEKTLVEKYLTIMQVLSKFLNAKIKLIAFGEGKVKNDILLITKTAKASLLSKSSKNSKFQFEAGMPETNEASDDSEGSERDFSRVETNDIDFTLFPKLPLHVKQEFMLRVNYDELFKLCQTNKEINEICKSESFWVEKIEYNYNIKNAKKVITYYYIPNKQIKYKEYWVDPTNNKQYGPYKEWYSNGKLMTTAVYNANKLEGKYTTFFENGKIFLIINFHDGKENGESKKFDRNGNLIEEKYYKDGYEVDEHSETVEEADMPETSEASVLNNLDSIPVYVKYEIMNKLEFDDLLSVCEINQNYWKTCNSDMYWKQRWVTDFKTDDVGNIELPSGIESWFEMYQLYHFYKFLTKNGTYYDNPIELKYITDLYISRSKLTKIPRSIGALINLQYLDLGQNLLTEIPTEILDLPLTWVDLSDNNLTNKDIPPSWFLRNMDYFNISGNLLTSLPKLRMYKKVMLKEGGFVINQDYARNGIIGKFTIRQTKNPEYQEDENNHWFR